MSKRTFLFFGILIVSVLVLPVSVGKVAPDNSNSVSIQTDDVLEKSFVSRGTMYRLRVNTSNHSVSVFANHFANNETIADYAVSLNGRTIIQNTWDAVPESVNKSKRTVLRNYYAGTERRNITLSTYGSHISIEYNFTVPRKHEGEYLRPTITNIEFDRINDTHGRVSFTLRSDSKWYHPMYYRIWTPSVSARSIPLHREKGENVTSASIVIPVDEGEPLDGEIRAYSGLLNESGPLYTQLEVYGQPGEIQFERVPYEPIELNRVSEYEYRNESSNGGSSILSTGEYRKMLGVLAVVLLGVILVALVGANRRQRP